MKKIITTILLLSTIQAIAQTQVRGYTRKDGTYVAPHTRTAPDSNKWNNYGSKSSNSYGSKDRDSDNDGIYNQYDKDDNNNWVQDDSE